MSLKKYSTLALRIGLAAVLFWFAINQFIDAEKWSGLLPELITFISPVTVVYINAVVEIILGSLILLGLFTRIAALIFSIHLVFIILSLGYGPSAVRDVGLLFASLSLALSGSNYLSLDNILKK